MLGGSALFLAGFALLVVVPIYNLLLPTRLRHFDGGYFTVAAVPWYLHNALFYLVRFTFLPFVTMTPIRHPLSPCDGDEAGPAGADLQRELLRSEHDHVG